MATTLKILNTANETRDYLASLGYAKVGSKYTHGRYENEAGDELIVTLKLDAGRYTYQSSQGGVCGVKYRVFKR